MRNWRFRVLLASVVVIAQACGSGTPEDGAPATAVAAEAQAEAKAENRITVRTADEPTDPCGWISVAEVEAVVGKLVEPPKKADGCLYVMTIPEDIAAKRKAHVDRIAAFQEKFKTEAPTFSGPMAEFESNPKSYAVTVSVDVQGDMAAEIGMNAGWELMAREAGVQRKKPVPPEGWDSVAGLPYGFSGRLGHVRVSVQAQAPDVPRDVLQRLAEAVRDRVPDLPFKTDNPYQIVQFGASDRKPCELLPRAEAEAVLGPLVVEPYRSSSNHPSLALADGHGCAYFTKGHRVFVLVPTWSDGEETFKLQAGLGSLMSAVLPEELTVFKGPWDKAQIARGTGALLFLKGDRLLEVHFGTAGVTRGNAVKLAASAMRRLAA